MEQRWKVLAITSVGLFMASLDLFIVNIAFPDLATDFGGASLASLSWVLNAYAIVFAALLVPAGRIADRIGRKRVFVTGLLLFSLASALCAAAPSIPLLGRRPDPAGGRRGDDAADHARADPARLSGRSSGRWRSASGRRSAGSPPRSAHRSAACWSQLSWRWIFVVNVPIGVITAIVAVRALGEVREPEDGRPDLLGAVDLALGIGLLTAGHRQGPGLGMGRPPHPRRLRSRPVALGRRLPAALRPPPRAGDRAATAAGPLLRAWQSRRGDLLRRLWGDAPLRGSAADRGLGLLGAAGRPRPLPRPADGGDLRGAFGHAWAGGSANGRWRSPAAWPSPPASPASSPQSAPHPDYAGDLPAGVRPRRRRGRHGARHPARRRHRLAAPGALRDRHGRLRDGPPARRRDRRRRPRRPAQRPHRRQTSSPVCSAAGSSALGAGLGTAALALAFGPPMAPGRGAGCPSWLTPQRSAA